MIFGVEIALVIYGLIALCTGKFKIGKDKILLGIGARVCGVVCLLPLPLVIVLGAIYGFVLGMQGKASQITTTYKWHFVALEALVAVGIAVVVMVLANILYKRQKQAAESSQV